MRLLRPVPRPAGLPAVLLAACLVACGRPDATSTGGAGEGSADRSGDRSAGGRGRVVVFGIDGADWQAIEPLVARGRMPAFKRLIEQGATGPLRSMEPSASPALWTTVATGVGPDRHGIHGFVVEATKEITE